MNNSRWVELWGWYDQPPVGLSRKKIIAMIRKEFSVTDIKREIAIAHWEYTKGIIERCISQQMEFDEMIGLMEYLYVESMLHGMKHGRDKLDAK